jgi:very-short-patch-repair endonuclease
MSKEKKNIDQIRLAFQERGYILLTNTYKNCVSPLPYKCPNGHQGQICWKCFRIGHGCIECNGSKNHSIEEIRDAFEKDGYILLSTAYINCKTPLGYLCPKGHRGQIRWNDFQQGHRCFICGGSKKKTIDEVRSAFEKRKYVLLSQEYRNARSLLSFICPQNHKGQIRWNAFRQGQGCSKCYGNEKYTIEEIRTAFAKEGYQLLSLEYGGCRSLLHFKCPNGHPGRTRWNSFRDGHRCPICGEWKNQRKLGEVLEALFPGLVRAQDNLEFLELLRVDYSIRSMMLAFEYDGQHHFQPTTYGGMGIERAKKLLATQQERDARKNRLCKENGYNLIRIAYYEKWDEEEIKRRIDRILTKERV